MTDFVNGFKFAVKDDINFALAFIKHSVLLIPFAFLLLILAIMIALFCLPFAMAVLSVWVLKMMISRSIAAVYSLSKKRLKS